MMQRMNQQAGYKKNPFLPFKNPRTGNWHGPHYSLRRQAELFKLAAKHNVLPLMPYSSKHPEVKRERAERGLQIQGTGVGKQVKGHKWERTMKSRLELRRRAMEAMPDMINVWRERINLRKALGLKMISKNLLFTSSLRLLCGINNLYHYHKVNIAKIISKYSITLSS